MVESLARSWQKTEAIWKEDEWARRAAYLSATLAFVALGIAALENPGLAIVFGTGATWMGYNTINYFN